MPISLFQVLRFFEEAILCFFLCLKPLPLRPALDLNRRRIDNDDKVVGVGWEYVSLPMKNGVHIEDKILSPLFYISTDT
jgi:hypothetical protein